MKTIITLILLLMLIACNVETTQRVIPKENQAKADSFIVRQMATIKITQRNDDEDLEDFLYQAKQNALELYGKDTLGIYNKTDGDFIPYDKCTPSQKESLRERYKEVVK